MRKSVLFFTLFTMAALLANTSCSLFETNPTTVAFQTTAAGVTVSPDTSVDTAKPAPQESSEASIPEQNSIEYLMDHTASSVSLQGVYLLSPQEVTVVDDSIVDGITDSVIGPKTRIPGGMIALPMDTAGNIVSEIDQETLFVLLDGRCVRFDVGTTSDGALLLNGLSIDKILGRRVADELYRKMDVQPEGELLAMVEPDPDVSYEILTLRTDWNDDGKEDTFRREALSDSPTTSGTLSFTDGATGQTTDVTSLCGTTDDGYTYALTSNTFYYDDGTAMKAIIDWVYVMDGDAESYIYTYDEENILHLEKIEGRLTLEDGAMQLLERSRVLGNLEDMIVPVTFDSQSIVVSTCGIATYWKANYDAVRDASILPEFYSVTLQDITAEKEIDGQIDVVSIPSGVAIFPIYTIENEDGTGYFYFRTLEQGECRLQYTAPADEPWNVTFREASQTEIFWCGFGG